MSGEVMKVKDRIRKIPHLSLIKRTARAFDVEVYLVGGYIRDIFLEQEPGNDFDFSVNKKTLKFAGEIAGKSGGRLIVLDEGERIYRVIIKDKKGFLYYDFSRFKGGTLEQDISRRDFPVNSLCVKLNDFPSSDIIDFNGGIKDLKKRLLRLDNERVLIQDPLRILRAFSLSARFGLRIENRTRTLLKKHRKLLSGVSGERISQELFKIFGSGRSHGIVRLMSDLSVIDEVIPYLSGCRKVSQGPYHHLDVWEHSLDCLLRLENLCGNRLLKNKDIEQYLYQELAGGRTRLMMLKLAALIHDFGKPPAKSKKKKKTIFHGHEKIGARMASVIAGKLKLSVKERKALEKIVFWHLRPGYLADTKLPSQRAVYRFFRDTGEEAGSVVIVSLADWRATRGVLIDRVKRYSHERIMLKVLSLYFEKKKQPVLPCLVNGHEIMNKFKLGPSPLIGEILRAIKEEQAVKKGFTRTRAYSLAKGIISKHRKDREKN